MQTQSNVPTTQKSAPPVTYTPPKGETVLKSDLVIQKVLLQQGLSKFVSDRKAQAGDMVRSGSAEKLGDDKKPVSFIPLTFQNLWMISENQNGDGKKFEFRRYEPRTAANESEPWEYIENGTKWKRTKVMNLFALLPSDIDAQEAELAKDPEDINVDKVLLPVVIPFRNTSFKAGKDVATLFAKAESISLRVGRTIPAFGTTMKLSCTQEKNDKGSFFVYKVETAGATDAKYKETAKSWYNSLAQMDVKIDESDLEDPIETGSTVGQSQF